MHINTDNVKVYIGKNEILKGIDINVDNKEFIGIIVKSLMEVESQHF